MCNLNSYIYCCGRRSHTLNSLNILISTTGMIQLNTDLTAQICVASNDCEFIIDCVAKRSDRGCFYSVKIWPGQKKSRCWVAGRGKRFFSSQKRPSWLWGPLSLMFKMVPGVLSFVVEASGEWSCSLSIHTIKPTNALKHKLHLNTQIVIIPTRFDLSWSSSGGYCRV